MHSNILVEENMTQMTTVITEAKRSDTTHIISTKTTTKGKSIYFISTPI